MLAFCFRSLHLTFLFTFCFYLNPANAFANQQENQEPAYCNPATFDQYEVEYTGKSPKRMHLYKIGGLYLAGMAVGRSKAEDVKELAISISPQVKNSNYCTWYFNDGNTEAEKTFTWIDLPRPRGSDTEGMTQEWLELVGDEFHTSAISFVSCAINYGFIAEGCNGQKHRGPSAFAMLLSYAGCSPKNSVKIANQIWGRNGIRVEMREALAKAAAELAAQNSTASEAIKKLMTAQP